MVARHMRRMIASLKTWAVRLKGWRGKRQRLWLRQLGYYLALGLVPVLLVDLVVLNAARDAIEEAVLDSRREMAHRTAAEIARIFSNVAFSLEGLARTVGTEPQDVRALLKKDALESSEVEVLYLVDAPNQIQAASASVALPASYDWDATWTKVAADSLYVALIEEFKETPKLFVALPVERDDQPPQVLIARLDFHRVWKKINLIRIGRTGYATLLHADDGHYLARPMRQSFYMWRRHPHIEAMRRPAGTLLWRDVGGVGWVTGFAPVRDWDWIVAIEQRQDEAYAPYNVLLYSIYAIIALFALGVLILGGLTRSSVVAPLVLLTHAVRRRRDGYPLIGTPIKRRDEIGELADAFVEMDQTLAERQRDLESTLDLQRHLIEDNPLAIAVLDAEYRVVQSNKAWASLLLPKQAAELSATHAGAQIRAWLEAHPHLQVVDSLAIEDAEGVMSYWNLRKAELSEGHRGKVLFVVEDQTQQHLLELHYMQAEKLSALGEVAAGVAHEIKNPLAIVQNTCDLLPRLGPEEEKERDETLRMMREAIRRIDDRVGSLLDFARPAQHLVEQINAAEVLGQLLDLETKHAEHLGISIERQFEPVPAVLINRDMLKDIYLNIIRNAFQAMPQGGHLQVSVRPEQEGVAIKICDTGTGIDSTQLSRIFEPFFSTKAPGEGTGLGLAIAQRQLREIGGHIEVTSRVGKGTCFALLLPYNKELTLRTGP